MPARTRAARIRCFANYRLSPDRFARADRCRLCPCRGTAERAARAGAAGARGWKKRCRRVAAVRRSGEARTLLAASSPNRPNRFVFCPLAGTGLISVRPGTRSSRDAWDDRGGKNRFLGQGGAARLLGAGPRARDRQRLFPEKESSPFSRTNTSISCCNSFGGPRKRSSPESRLCPSPIRPRRHFSCQSRFDDGGDGLIDVNLHAGAALQTGWMLAGTTGAYCQQRIHVTEPSGEVCDVPLGPCRRSASRSLLRVASSRHGPRLTGSDRSRKRRR